MSVYWRRPLAPRGVKIPSRSTFTTTVSRPPFRGGLSVLLRSGVEAEDRSAALIGRAAFGGRGDVILPGDVGKATEIMLIGEFVFAGREALGAARRHDRRISDFNREGRRLPELEHVLARGAKMLLDFQREA